MYTHTNEARENSSRSFSENKSLTNEIIADAQEIMHTSKNSHTRVGFQAVEWQKTCETDSRVYFKVGKSSSSSSPDTPDPSENIKLLAKVGECALKAATICRLVASKTFEAVDVGKKLEQNSLRKATEVDSQFAPYYISIADKYRVAVNDASEKASEAKGTAEVAHIAGGNALKASKKLSELTDIELKTARDANFQITWTIAAAKRAKSETYRVAYTTIETMKTFWKKLCDVRNEEMHFNKNVDGQTRKKGKLVNIVFACLFVFGCLVLSLKSCLNIIRDWDTLISAGVTLIIGSIMGFVINSQGSTIESVAQSEKIRKAMEVTEEWMHRLDKYFKKNKFSSEMLTSDEELHFEINFLESLNLLKEDEGIQNLRRMKNGMNCKV